MYIKNLEVFVLKKIFLTSLISFGLLLVCSGLVTEASVTTDNVPESDGGSIQQATTVSLSPLNLSGNTDIDYALTVSTNVSGTVSFTFNPGIYGLPAQRENGSGSRKFIQKWRTNGLNNFHDICKGY